MKEEVTQALAEVAEFLKADGGNVELVAIEDGVVKVKLTGACGTCPFAAMTLKNKVEAYVREKVPAVKSVEMA